MVTILDAEWFERIRRINAQVPRRLRTSSYHEAKESFLASSTAEPDFQYPLLNDERYDEKLARLAELARDIDACNETHPVVKDLYQRKIKEKTAQLHLVRSAFLAHQDFSEHAPHSASFTAHSESVYGAPKQDIFNHLVLQVQKQLSVLPARTKAVPEYDRTEAVFNKSVHSSVPDMNMLEARESENEILADAEVVKGYFEEALQQAGLQHWEVIINPKKVGSITVWPQTRKISIPNSGVLKARPGEKQLTERKLAGLIAHEVFTHAVRAENGRNAPLQLLSIGLDGYLPGEEGVATYREQQYTGATDYAAPNVYLAIGLAYGLDRGGGRRTFREVFNIMRDYYALRHIGTDTNIDTLSFLTCVQVFKGANAAVPHIVLTRDTTYREGNIAIHQLILKDPSRVTRFDVGKYDPTNTAHVTALTKLNILSQE